MTVTEVQAPDFDVSITGTGDHQTTVEGNVEAKHRLRVTVQREKHLHGKIQRCQGEGRTGRT